MVLMMYNEALNRALREEMLKDSDLILMGEDIGSAWQGAFKVTKGLQEEFGKDRVRDTPISEGAIIGAAIGASITGMKVVAEIMFGDLVTLAMDQVVNQAAKARYMFGGKISVPIVIRLPFGSGGQYATHHSQSLEAWFIHIPGLRVIQPSTPYDAYGLMKTAINWPDPVICCEHKFLYRTEGEVPEEEFSIPLGKGDIKREGDDVTIIATSIMVLRALEAAEELSKIGISAEVLDPRTISPLDDELIAESIRKTGKAVIVHEACNRGGISGEISKVIIENTFDYLDAPIKTVAGYDVPIPFHPEMEKWVIPNKEKIIQGVKEII
ncbi:MAG: alpha-ketoacid dehydrogenase subunit beta [Candidatus Lokiarchaeota archaeon]|nr:alpha-ketoacid dehydrogenase subunit beta [Candidatus Lokiarchaeota archaeon]